MIWLPTIWSGIGGLASGVGIRPLHNERRLMALVLQPISVSVMSVYPMHSVTQKISTDANAGFKGQENRRPSTAVAGHADPS